MKQMIGMLLIGFLLSGCASVPKVGVADLKKPVACPPVSYCASYSNSRLGNQALQSWALFTQEEARRVLEQSGLFSEVTAVDGIDDRCSLGLDMRVTQRTKGGEIVFFAILHGCSLGLLPTPANGHYCLTVTVYDGDAKVATHEYKHHKREGYGLFGSIVWDGVPDNRKRGISELIWYALYDLQQKGMLPAESAMEVQTGGHAAL